MNELERLKTARPGDIFQVGYGPAGAGKEPMVVESNDGRAVVLRRSVLDQDFGSRLRIPLDVLGA